jgi:hypothetical protein
MQVELWEIPRAGARESLGMRRTYQYVAMTKDEAQRRRWTFYEAVNIQEGQKEKNNKIRV